MGSEGNARRCELCGALLKRKDWQKHKKECPALEDVRQFIADVRTDVLRLKEKWGDKILDEILYSLALDVIRDTIYAVKYRDTFTEKAPEWFKKCRRVYVKMDRGAMVWGDCLWLPWMDHMKYTRDGKVVSEPYALGVEAVKKLLDFCEKTGLRFTITGDSYHFPTQTLRIIIHPPESDVHK
jgi:hypothetical protein